MYVTYVLSAYVCHLCTFSLCTFILLHLFFWTKLLDKSHWSCANCTTLNFERPFIKFIWVLSCRPVSLSHFTLQINSFERGLHEFAAWGRLNISLSLEPCQTTPTVQGKKAQAINKFLKLMQTAYFDNTAMGKGGKTF